jgi:hypothetical protein
LGGRLAGDKARSPPSLFFFLQKFSILALLKNPKRRKLSHLLFSHSQALCSIQVRDRTVVIDLESFKSISSISSPLMGIRPDLLVGR